MPPSSSDGGFLWLIGWGYGRRGRYREFQLVGFGGVGYSEHSKTGNRQSKGEADMTKHTQDIQDLIELGLDAKRLAKHTDEEIKMALCAVQESGNDIEKIEEMGDKATAALYAESALGW